MCSRAIDYFVPGLALVKPILAVLSSIGFVYVHGDNPGPGRAADLFTGGLVLSYLAIHPEWGLSPAIISHMFHNIPYALRQIGQTQLPSPV